MARDGGPDPSGRREGRPPPSDGRAQRTGVDAIVAALDAGEPVRRILVARNATGDAVARLRALARARGVPVEPAGPGDLRRLSAGGAAAGALERVGAEPDASPDTAFLDPGARWLLVGASYPGNVGAALRTMEVSGAAARAMLSPGPGATRRVLRSPACRPRPADPTSSRSTAPRCSTPTPRSG